MRGAREHNLKDVTVAFPRDRLVVITGLSGSGKSSLAFDTIYAEGQRRYVESLSAYARQFLGQMEKPDVDQIDGLSPAISIDQKGASRNPRSTVGTVTEIYDHLRLLFARIGQPHCPDGHAIERQSVQQIVDQVLALPEGTRLLVLGPLIKDRKTEGLGIIDAARRQGFVRVRVDGELVDIADSPAQARQVQAPLDRGRGRPLHRSPRRGARGRHARAGRPAHRPGDRRWSSRIRTPRGWPTPSRPPSGWGRGPSSSPRPRATARRPTSRSAATASATAARIDGFTVDELEPRSFSFNSPHGACPGCAGLGTKLEIDPALLIPDPSKSLGGGALGTGGLLSTDQSWRMKIIEAVCAAHGWDFKAPLARPARGGPPAPPVRGQGPGAGPRPLPPRARREHLQGQLRGHRHQPRAPLPRVRLGLHQGRDREVHGHQAVPDVRRQAAAPGDPGGDHRRRATSGTSRRCRSPTP